VTGNRWDDVGFIVFDAPKESGTWFDRIGKAVHHIRGSFAGIIPWQTVDGVKHLARVFRQVGKAGGEGPETDA
jgi:hypothetical protein